MAILVGNFKEQTNSTNIYYASELITHPEFRPKSTTLTPDVGIIRLKNHVKITNDISTVCLPDNTVRNFEVSNKNLVALGWGVKKDSKVIYSNILQETTLKVIDSRLKLCSKYVTYNSSIYYCAVDDSTNNGHSSNVIFFFLNIFFF